MLVCPVPEEEHAEGHSNRIPLSANPNGLQDPRVFQLAADEVIIKHPWFLTADGHTVIYRKTQNDKVGLVHANNHKKKVLEIYLHVIWFNTANKKGVASEMFVIDHVSDLFIFSSNALKRMVDLKMTFPVLTHISHLSILSTSSSRDCWNLLLTVGAWYFLVTGLLFLMCPPLC